MAVLYRRARFVSIGRSEPFTAFTGLESSSSFTASLLPALHSLKGEFLQPQQLAYEAIHQFLLLTLIGSAAHGLHAALHAHAQQRQPHYHRWQTASRRG
ncbi:MAG: hypothetical protein MUF81_02490 [Verrucomicrobia bacterium]|nr:hypothetical protein [Verrucomicrobiota bacterium]